MNQLSSKIPDFLIFLSVPFFIEMMVSEQARVRVSLMITLIVDALEGVRAWFTLFRFKMRGVDLEISLAALGKVVVVFGFIWTIALQTFCTLKIASKDSIISLPAIFALRDTRIHVGPSDSSNKAANVKAAIDEFLCHGTAL